MTQHSDGWKQVNLEIEKTKKNMKYMNSTEHAYDTHTHTHMNIISIHVQYRINVQHAGVTAA